MAKGIVDGKCLKKRTVTSLMNNVPKWSDTL